MTTTFKTAIYGGLGLFMLCFASKAQTNTTAAKGTSTVKTTLFEGIVAVGYIDDGATINFTGPAIKLTHKPFIFMIGMLPSLKIKEDKTANGPKNAMLIPSLGFGATAVYKHLAMQIPFLYNAKTATKDGQWHAGIGLGYKF
ncbi:MAG: hypothetical protein WKF66_00205 [Pedobacter sp.]